MDLSRVFHNTHVSHTRQNTSLASHDSADRRYLNQWINASLPLTRCHKYKSTFKNNKTPTQSVCRVKRPKVLLQEGPSVQHTTTSKRFLLKYVVEANKQKTDFRKPSG